MAINKGIQILGEKELAKRLARLGKKSTRNKMARPAVREAGAEVRKLAKFFAGSSRDTGLLQKSIKSVVRTARGGTGVYAVIGPVHGFKRIHPGTAQFSVVRFQDPTKYAHLVEFGTVHSAKKPFLRPAHDVVNSQRIITSRLGKELAREARRK